MIEKTFRRTRGSVLAAVLVLLTGISCCLGGCADTDEKRSKKGEGRYIMVESRTVWENGETLRTTYEYDDNCMQLGRRDERRYADGTKYVRDEEYVYAEDGEACRIDAYENGEYTHYIDLELYKNGQVEEMTYRYPDGSSYSEWSWEFDENGYCTAQIGQSGARDEAEYDDDGKILWETSRASDGSERRWEYSYDKDGAITRIDWWYEEPGYSQYQYALCECDKDGNEVSRQWYNSDGSKAAERYEYKYDKNGNLVKEWYYNYDTLVYTKTIEYDWKDVDVRGLWGE